MRKEILVFASTLIINSCVHERDIVNSNEIVGSWKLHSFKIKKNNISKNWKSNANGLLIYSKDGYMSVSINSDDSKVGWIDSILFYAGSYRVIGKKIEHYVLNATSKNRIGKEMIRDAFLKGESLTLQAEGNFGEATLIWKKL